MEYDDEDLTEVLEYGMILACEKRVNHETNKQRQPSA